MIIKYIFDRMMALVGLMVLWPVLLIVAIMIRVKMPGGPVLFVQKRVGKDGRLFEIHKFRTMTLAPKVQVQNGSSGEKWSSVSVAGDARITPFGAKLRKYKIDELPELWDVLRGEMSFVGPRPDVPGYADKLDGENRDVLKLRPGITGPASLKYRNEEEILADVEDPQKYNDEVIYPDKVRLNCYYYRNYSFWMDIKMILATVLGKRMSYMGEEI